MRLLLAFLMLVTVAAAAETLESLKKQFPTHVAGAVTEKSDPAIQECWSRYKRRVDGLTMDNLSAEVLKLQHDADYEHYTIGHRLADRHNVLNASARHAASQNAAWLKQKLIPYLKRLAQFQRGR